MCANIETDIFHFLDIFFSSLSVDLCIIKKYENCVVCDQLECNLDLWDGPSKEFDSSEKFKIANSQIMVLEW